MKQATNTRLSGLRPFLLSGLLFGLSWPSYPYIHLEFLAWVWMVPMLLALKQVRTFRAFLGRVFIALLVAFVFAESWLLLSQAWGAAILFFLSAAVSSIPFVCFYIVWRRLGWRVSLWSAPVVWTAFDWLYHISEGSFGWLSMGLTQSSLWPLVQYVDITGVWGVTFWLVLFNVLVVIAIEDFRAPEPSLRIENRPAFARRLALILAGMILPPLVYSAVAFIRETRPAANRRTISVLMVQPDIDPWQKFDQQAATLASATALTDNAMHGPKPDLIVWPETAVPYFLGQDTAVKDFVYRAVSRWNTPLLTGTENFELKAHPGDGRLDFRPLNAAVLLTPEPGQTESGLTAAKASSGHSGRIRRFEQVNASEMYYKRCLFPMVETVPFMDRFPWLSRLLVHIAWAGGSSEAGKNPTVFSLSTRDGEPVTVAAPICYEQLYPAKVGDLVRNGAQMLALITNEGWWSQTDGEYKLAAFSRLRAIETRRTIARTANTGLTCFIDPLGRIHDEAPWWSRQTVLGNARLSNEVSLYVRYTDYFPKACAWLSLLLAVVVAAQTITAGFRRRWRKPESGVRQQTAFERG